MVNETTIFSIHIAKQCRKDEFTCDNKDCIPLDAKCNGIADCLDNSDELGDCNGKICIKI